MDLDKRRKEVELMRVRVAKEELLLKIDEKRAEIDRLQQHVDKQEEAEKRLREEIK